MKTFYTLCETVAETAFLIGWAVTIIAHIGG